MTDKDDLSTETFHEPAASLKPGTIIGGKFELLEQIGRGGMGVVWKANDRVADRLVALKFVPSELNRFETEMQRVRETFKKVHALQHQSICPLYTLEDGGHLGYYLVMKYLEGETLDAYVQRKAAKSEVLPINQVVALLSRAAVALDYAHQNAVIHRDIKPSNIFLVKSGGKLHVQIIDFGLADEIRTSMTRTSQVQIEISGTRPYMSPEQWRGRTQSPATDQYALAVVAYELLAGHVPFKNSDVAMLRLAVMNDMPEPVSTISDTANSVLFKALAKDAADRFPTCRDFIAALGGAWTMVGEETTEEETFTFTLPNIPRWGWALAGSMFLVLLLGAIVGGMGNRNKTTPPPPAELPAAIAKSDEPVAPAQDRRADTAPPMPPPTYKAPPRPIDDGAFNELFNALRSGNLEHVRGLVSQDASRGPDLNVINGMGDTLLERFVMIHPTLSPSGVSGTSSPVEIVNYLISRGVDVNRHNDRRNGETVLHRAVLGQRPETAVEIVKTLVSHGAVVDAKCHAGTTPLLRVAVIAPNSTLAPAAVEVVRYLISQDADVNVKDRNGNTPLGLARSEEIKALLRAAGATYDLLNAARSGTLADVRSCLARGERGDQTTDLQNNTPLHLAAQSNSDVEVVRHLLSVPGGGSALVNAKNIVGDTPLHRAAQSSSNVEVVRALVSAPGGNALMLINAKNNTGNTPLHLAAWSNSNVEVIRALVSVGVDVNAKNNTGDTPLHRAAQSNFSSSVEVLRYLVSVPGVNVNATNNTNQTPLSVITGTTSLAESKRTILRNAGGVTGTVRQPAPTVASSRSVSGTSSPGSTTTSSTSTGSPPPPANIFEAANRGTLQDVRSFISADKTRVNADDGRGGTPLHLAVTRNTLDIEIVRYLVEQGANINARTNLGRTPLHSLVTRPNTDVDIVKYLVSKGAGVNTKDGHGETLLHDAARNRNIEVLEYLVNLPGAEVNARSGHDGRGQTPLNAADTKEKQDIIRNAGGKSAIEL